MEELLNALKVANSLSRYADETLKTTPRIFYLACWILAVEGAKEGKEEQLFQRMLKLKSVLRALANV